MVIQFILLILGAYLLGSVPAAYLVAKWSRGIDIRQYGSGNVGASNVLRLTSKWLALPVILFDLGKGAAMIWVAQLLGFSIAQQVMVALAAIIGHSWPVFLRFNGGRGALTIAGVSLILAPKVGLILVSSAFLFTLFHQLALGTILAAAGLPVFSWFLGQPLSVEDKLPVTLGFLAMFLIIVLRRLTAPRTSVTSSVSPGKLFLYRLLFDRDIRNREAWINRKPIKTKSTGQTSGHHEGKS